MKKENFLEIFEIYIQKFPFRGEILSHYYFKIVKKGTITDYHEFNYWFKNNKDSISVKKIIENNSKIIFSNLERDDKKWNKIGKSSKPMVPTLKSEEKSISFFPTDD